MQIADSKFYTDILREDFPQLDLSTLRIIGSGWDHAAVEVSGNIFRIPKNNNLDNTARVVSEVAILKLLHGKLPVAVPNPLFIAPGNNYFGYPKLPGLIAYDKPELTNTDEFIDQWIDIVSTLHEVISGSDAKEAGVSGFNPMTHFGYFDRVVELSKSPSISKHIREFALRVLAKIGNPDLANRETYLLHHDLHAKNILLDPTSSRITGVIDWSDMLVAPLEYEFWVWEYGTANSLDRAARRYEEKTGQAINTQETRTFSHLAVLSDYFEEVQARNLKDSRETQQHIDRWIKEGQ